MGNTCKTYPSLYKKITQVRNEDGTEIIGNAISKESFHSLIRLYNTAMLHVHHPEYILYDETEYTDEQLLDIARNLDDFRSRGRSLARAREIYMKQMSEQYGSVYNMAAKMLSDNLTGKQINELQSGLLGAFYDVINSEKDDMRLTEFLESIDNDKFFKMLLKTKKQLLNDITGWIDELESNNEDTSAIRELTGKLFGMSYNPRGNFHDVDGNFESMVDYELIMMTPVFSKILGRRINENFVIDNQENIDAIDDIDLDDTKNTDLESWQKDKDMDSATSNMSSYVYMALSLVPETESVSKAKYFLDGKEISAEEYDRLAEDSKSNDNEVSNKAKILLKGVTVSFETEINDKISSLTGYTIMSNPQVVARRLSTLLIDCHSYDDMKRVLQKQGYLYEDLVNRLETDYMFRNTFVSFFNKYQLDVVLTDSDRKSDGTITYHSKPVNKRTKKETVRTYLNKLKFKKGTPNSIFNIVKAEGKNRNNLSLNPKKRMSAKSKYFGVTSRDSEGNTVYDDKHSIYYGLDYYAQSGEFDTASPANDYDHLKGAIRFIFETFGIDIEEDTLVSIASDKNNVAILNDTAKKLFESKMFSELHVTDVNSVFGDRDKTVSDNYYNMLMMANASRYSSYSTNMFTYAGNKQSSRILPSAITSFFKSLKITRGENIKALLEEKFLKSDMFVDKNGVPYNQILRDILDSASFNVLSKSFKDVIGITRNMGIDNILAEDTDRRQHLLMDITTYFQNRKFRDDIYEEDEGTPFLKRKDGIVSQYKKYRDDYAYVPSFITGDNNTSRYYRLLHHTENEIVNGIYRLYLSELRTIKLQDQFNKEGIAFYANDKESYFSSYKQRFGILTFLNEYIGQTDAATRDKILNGGVTLEEFDRIVRDYLDKGFKEFMNLLDMEGITSRIYRGQDDSVGKYRNLEWLIGDDVPKNDADARQAALEAKLKDYYLNYKFGMYNIMNLTQVSTLFFRGVEDLQKRNKATLTNGYQVMVDAVDMEGNKIFADGDAQRVVYFNDISLAPSKADMEAIYNTAYKEYKRRGLSDDKAAKKAAKFVEDYKTSTITDGEAYRSFESYRNILMSIGEPFWSVNKERAYRRIMEIIEDNSSYEDGDKNNNLTFDAFSEINKLMLTMQPIKPINDGIEDYSGGIKIPFQLKYAEVPILPEMYPAGSKLRQMGLWMRENKVDLMPSTKCGKKGVFGAADLQYKTKDGSYVGTDGKCLKGMKSDGVTEIDGEEKPTMDEQKRYIAKTGKDGRISYDDSVSFDEIMANCQSIEADESTGKMHGYVIHTLPVSTMLIQSNNPDHINAMSTLSSQARKIITKAIKSDVVYTVDGKKIDGKRLARLYNYLQSMKYARSAKSFLKDITNDNKMRRKFTRLVLSSERMNPALVERLANGISMSELASAKDFESLLISEYKKSVVKQMIDGGMAIQAASLGVGNHWVADQELNAIVKDGVVVGVECEIAFDFFYKNVSGKDTSLEYDAYCNQDGTFKMTENGKQTLIERDFPGILDIVGVRIPTEKEYSMFAMHIKRVTPKGASNSIKLPSWCTTRADFDFDIDKLYLMRHNYVSKMEFTNEDVWKDIYKGEKGLQAALERARDSVSEEEKAELAKKLGHNPFLHDYWDYLPLNFAMESKEALFEGYAEKRKSLTHIKPSIDVTADLSKLTANDDIDKAINNALVDIYLGVLSDPSTSFDSMSHGGFDGASEAARFSRVLQNLDALKSIKAIDSSDYKALFDEEGNIKVKELMTLLELDKDLDFKPEYDYSEPETSMLFKEKNQAGDNLIGIFANGDMNAFISTKLKKLRFNNSSRILFGSLAEKVSEVNGSTDEADIANSDIGCNLLNSTVNNVEILKNLAELLGASVDAVKNPVLEYLNLNTDTADVAGMLFRLGYSMTDVALLLNQPVVRKACEYMRYNNVRSVSTALRHVLTDNYGFTKDEVKSMFDNDKSGYNYSVLTQDNLAKTIFNGNSIFKGDVTKMSSKDGELLGEIKDITRNVAVLFNMATSNAINLGSYVRKVRNTSSNTLKSRFADFISQKAKSENSSFGNLEIETNDTMKSPISEDWKEWEADTFNKSINEFLMENADHPFGYENALYNINRFFMDYMMKKYTPYASGVYTRTVSDVGRLTSKNGLNGDTIEVLHRFIPMFRMAHSNGKFNPANRSPYNRVNKDGTVGELMYNAEFYINSSNDNSFMGNIARLIKGEPNLYARTDEEIMGLLNFLSANEFFDNINSGYISENSNIEALTFSHSFYISPSEKMALKYSFMELYERYPKLARDVFMHFYYAYGINPVYNQVMGLAPVELLKNLIVDEDSNTSYFDMFDGSDSYNKSDDLYGFKNRNGLYYAFIISQKDNPDVVPVVYRGEKSGKTLTISGYGVRDLILNRYKNANGKFSQTYSVKPVIKYKGDLYALRNSTGLFGYDSITTEVTGDTDGSLNKIIYEKAVILNTDGTDDFVTSKNWHVYNEDNVDNVGDTESGINGDGKATPDITVDEGTVPTNDDESNKEKIKIFEKLPHIDDSGKPICNNNIQ